MKQTVSQDSAQLFRMESCNWPYDGERKGSSSQRSHRLPAAKRPPRIRLRPQPVPFGLRLDPPQNDRRPRTQSVAYQGGQGQTQKRSRETTSTLLVARHTVMLVSARGKCLPLTLY
jgi:hypothetical protein